jgi:uncharacterized protein DUF4157
MSSSPEFEEKSEPDLRPLDPALRSRAEAALGQDLGRVRVARDAAAHAKADALGARALTSGQDIYFARGEYAPDTDAGERLILHELAHVVQQRGAAAGASGREALETEAEVAAARATRGERAAVRLKAAARVQKQDKGRSAAPTIARHPVEITATPPEGTIAGGGFAIRYLFNVVKGSVSVPLVLHVPAGVSVTVTPLTELGASDYRVQNAEGSGARAVVITVNSRLKVPPKLQITFGRSAASYVVVVQFPVLPEKSGGGT